jgi:hypothetical protein
MTKKNVIAKAMRMTVSMDINQYMRSQYAA